MRKLFTSKIRLAVMALLSVCLIASPLFIFRQAEVNNITEASATVVYEDTWNGSVIEPEEKSEGVFEYFGGGSGIAGDPYLIYKGGHLAYLSQSVLEGNTYSECHFKLMNNIDMASIPFTPIGKDGAFFRGFFNGEGKTIGNLYINQPDRDVGLFGGFAAGTIANPSGVVQLHFENPKVISESERVGVLAGWINANVTDHKMIFESITVSNGYVSGTNHVGGILGRAYSGNRGVMDIKTCRFSGTVYATLHGGGGIVGRIEIQGAGASGNENTVNVENCTSDGEVRCEVSTGTGAYGGIVGFAYRSANYSSINVKGCSSSMDVYTTSVANTTWLASAGGIIGAFYDDDHARYGTSRISDSYATGNMYGQNTSSHCIGGFIGYIRLNPSNGGYSGPVIFENNYATGDVYTPGYYAGGFIGFSYAIFISDIQFKNCYATGNVSTGLGISGGFVGYVYNNREGESPSVKNKQLFENCYATGNVEAKARNSHSVGGFVGRNYTINNNQSIEYKNCYSTGDVLVQGFSDGTYRASVGGFVGSYYAITAGTGTVVSIENCFSTGNVTAGGASPLANNAGGFLGMVFLNTDGAAFRVKNSFSSGNVSGNNTQNIGGFVGYVQQSSSATSTTVAFENCYSRGPVTTAYAGADHYASGFVGANNISAGAATFTRCYTLASVRHNRNMPVLNQSFASQKMGTIDPIYVSCYFNSNQAGSGSTSIGTGVSGLTNSAMVSANPGVAPSGMAGFTTSDFTFENNKYPQITSLYSLSDIAKAHSQASVDSFTDQYSVTFFMGDALNSSVTLMQRSNQQLLIPFTRSGYTIKGWSTAPNLGGEFIPYNDTFMADASVSYYAVWSLVEKFGQEDDSTDNLKPLGSINNPVKISSAQHLLTMARQVLLKADYDGTYFEQTADIDMAVLDPDKGEVFFPIGSVNTDFRGHFDGKGKTIQNLTIEVNNFGNANERALFGRMAAGSLKNMNLRNSVVSGGAGIAPLVGYLYNYIANTEIIIDNCHSDGGEITATSTNSGGLLGIIDCLSLNTKVTVTNSSSQNMVIYGAGTSIGGFIGQALSEVDPGNLITVENCFAANTVMGVVNSVAGFIGRVYNVAASSNSQIIIRNCYSEGAVEGIGAAVYGIGGLIGELLNYTSNGYVGIIDCYSNAAVTSIGHSNTTWYASMGGLIGMIYHATNTAMFTEVINCYATGEIRSTAPNNGQKVGGLIGFIRNAAADGKVEVSASKATGAVFGEGHYSGGLIGEVRANGARSQALVWDCEATGNVSSSGYEIGGLIGLLYAITAGTDASQLTTIKVWNCRATGDVETTTGAANGAGGAIGIIYSTVNYAYIEVKNVVAEGNVVSAGNVASYYAGAGGFLGKAYFATSAVGTSFLIENCTSYGDATGTAVSDARYVGGFVGYVGTHIANAVVKFKDCTSYGSASGIIDVGGFVGYILSNQTSTVAEFENCTAYGFATNGSYETGGFVGSALASGSSAQILITNARAEGAANSTDINGYSVGGFAGALKATGTSSSVIVSNAVSLGDATTRAYSNSTYSASAGGFVGLIEATGATSQVSVLSSYSVGYVTTSHSSGGSYAGGFVGYLRNTNTGTVTISDSYSSGNVLMVSGTVGGGFIGFADLTNASSKVNISNTYSRGNAALQANQAANDIGGYIGLLKSSATSSNGFKVSSSYSLGKALYNLGTAMANRGFVGTATGTTNSFTNCYFNKDSSSATSDSFATGLDQSAFAVETLPTGFASATWVATNGVFPQLKVFAESTTQSVVDHSLNSVGIHFAQKFKITYYKNDGTAAFFTEYLERNAPLSNPFTRTGFALLGWDTKPEANTTVYYPDGLFTGTAAVNLYARWRIVDRLGGGDGTQATPLIINSLTDLVTFRNNVNNGVDYFGIYIRQYSDIQILEDWTPIGSELTPFKGFYNGQKTGGQNSVITGLKVNNPGTAYQGFFGYIVGGSVRNLTISGSSVSGGLNTGTVIGYLLNNTANNQIVLENIRVTGASSVTANGENSGGLFGHIRTSALGASIVVRNCESSANVTSSLSIVGGLVGRSVNQTAGTSTAYATILIENSAATGDISGTTIRSFGVGGLAGFVQNNGNYTTTTIRDCSASGNISGAGSANTTWYASVGGFVGILYTLTGGTQNTINVSNCAASGTVTGTATGNGHRIGGFVGSATNGVGTATTIITISNSTASGNVANNGLGIANGGFAGLTQGAGAQSTVLITGCSATGNVSTKTTYASAGFVGMTHITTAGGTGATAHTKLIFDNCSATGSVTNRHINGRVFGGFAGYVNIQVNHARIQFESCRASGDITTDGRTDSTWRASAGGFAGGVYIVTGTTRMEVSFNNCTASGYVFNDGNMNLAIASADHANMGGFIGQVYNNAQGGSTSFTNCRASGDVVTRGHSVGGFVGRTRVSNVGVVTYDNCSATGNVGYDPYPNDGKLLDTTDHTGGFAGIILCNSVVGGSVVVNNCSASGTVTGMYRAGGFVGYILNDIGGTNVTLTNCTASGDVTGTNNDSIGGFVGKAGNNNNVTNTGTDAALSITMRGCSAIGNVNVTAAAADYSGGFAGYVFNTYINGTVTIEDCFSTGSVTTVATGGTFAGGFIGYVRIVTAYEGTNNGCFIIIRGSESYGDVHATGAAIANRSEIGGFIGSARAEVTGGAFIFSNSHAYGSIYGATRNVGGFLGVSLNALGATLDIDNCSANGNITIGANGGQSEGEYATSNDTHIGGFVGEIYISRVTNCFATGSIVGGRTYVGGFAGRLYNNRSTDEIFVENCYATGDVTSAPITASADGRIGGFAGDIYVNTAGTATTSSKITVNNCYATGSVNNKTTFGDYTGGFAGALQCNTNYTTLSVTNCYATGDVKSSAGLDTTYRSSTGGFAGLIYTNGSTSSSVINVENCYATGNAESTHANGQFTGGFAGYVRTNSNTNLINIRNSFATGNVSSYTTDTGGFIGYAYTAGTGVANITNCYSRGNVSTNANSTASLGGFVGRVNATTANNIALTRCYSTGSIKNNGHTNPVLGAGFTNNNASGKYESCYWNTTSSGATSSAGGAGLTTTQMIGDNPTSMVDFTSANGWTLKANMLPQISAFASMPSSSAPYSASHGSALIDTSGGGGAITATVTFNSNGGEGSMPNQTLSPGQSLSPNSFTKRDHIFAGWAKQTALSTVVYVDGAAFIDTSSITLYAVWKENIPTTRNAHVSIASRGESVLVNVNSLASTPFANALSFADGKLYTSASTGSEYSQTGVTITQPTSGNLLISTTSEAPAFENLVLYARIVTRDGGEYFIKLTLSILNTAPIKVTTAPSLTINHRGLTAQLNTALVALDHDGDSLRFGKASESYNDGAALNLYQSDGTTVLAATEGLTATISGVLLNGLVIRTTSATKVQTITVYVWVTDRFADALVPFSVTILNRAPQGTTLVQNISIAQRGQYSHTESATWAEASNFATDNDNDASLGGALNTDVLKFASTSVFKLEGTTYSVYDSAITGERKLNDTQMRLFASNAAMPVKDQTVYVQITDGYATIYVKFTLTILLTAPVVSASSTVNVSHRGASSASVAASSLASSTETSAGANGTINLTDTQGNVITSGTILIYSDTQGTVNTNSLTATVTGTSFVVHTAINSPLMTAQTYYILMLVSHPNGMISNVVYIPFTLTIANRSPVTSNSSVSIASRGSNSNVSAGSLATDPDGDSLKFTTNELYTYTSTYVPYSTGNLTITLSNNNQTMTIAASSMSPVINAGTFYALINDGNGGEAYIKLELTIHNQAPTAKGLTTIYLFRGNPMPEQTILATTFAGDNDAADILGFVSTSAEGGLINAVYSDSNCSVVSTIIGARMGDGITDNSAIKLFVKANDVVPSATPIDVYVVISDQNEVDAKSITVNIRVVIQNQSPIPKPSPTISIEATNVYGTLNVADLAEDPDYYDSLSFVNDATNGIVLYTTSQAAQTANNALSLTLVTDESSGVHPIADSSETPIVAGTSGIAEIKLASDISIEQMLYVRVTDGHTIIVCAFYLSIASAKPISLGKSYTAPQKNTGVEIKAEEIAKAQSLTVSFDDSDLKVYTSSTEFNPATQSSTVTISKVSSSYFIQGSQITLNEELYVKILNSMNEHQYVRFFFTVSTPPPTAIGAQAEKLTGQNALERGTTKTLNVNGIATEGESGMDIEFVNNVIYIRNGDVYTPDTTYASATLEDNNKTIRVLGRRLVDNLTVYLRVRTAAFIANEIYASTVITVADRQLTATAGTIALDLDSSNPNASGYPQNAKNYSASDLASDPDADSSLTALIGALNRDDIYIYSVSVNNFAGLDTEQLSLASGGGTISNNFYQITLSGEVDNTNSIQIVGKTRISAGLNARIELTLYSRPRYTTEFAGTSLQRATVVINLTVKNTEPVEKNSGSLPSVDRVLKLRVGTDISISPRDVADDYDLLTGGTVSDTLQFVPFSTGVYFQLPANFTSAGNHNLASSTTDNTHVRVQAQTSSALSLSPKVATPRTGYMDSTAFPLDYVHGAFYIIVQVADATMLAEGRHITVKIYITVENVLPQFAGDANVQIAAGNEVIFSPDADRAADPVKYGADNLVENSGSYTFRNLATDNDRVAIINPSSYADYINFANDAGSITVLNQDGSIATDASNFIVVTTEPLTRPSDGQNYSDSDGLPVLGLRIKAIRRTSTPFIVRVKIFDSHLRFSTTEELFFEFNVIVSNSAPTMHAKNDAGTVYQSWEYNLLQHDYQGNVVANQALTQSSAGQTVDNTYALHVYRPATSSQYYEFSAYDFATDKDLPAAINGSAFSSEAPNANLINATDGKQRNRNPGIIATGNSQSYDYLNITGLDVYNNGSSLLIDGYNQGSSIWFNQFAGKEIGDGVKQNLLRIIPRQRTGETTPVVLRLEITDSRQTDALVIWVEIHVINSAPVPTAINYTSQDSATGAGYFELVSSPNQAGSFEAVTDGDGIVVTPARVVTNSVAFTAKQLAVSPYGGTLEFPNTNIGLQVKAVLGTNNVITGLEDPSSPYYYANYFTVSYRSGAVLNDNSEAVVIEAKSQTPETWLYVEFSRNIREVTNYSNNICRIAINVVVRNSIIEPQFSVPDSGDITPITINLSDYVDETDGAKTAIYLTADAATHQAITNAGFVSYLIAREFDFNDYVSVNGFNSNLAVHRNEEDGENIFGDGSGIQYVPVAGDPNSPGFVSHMGVNSALWYKFFENSIWADNVPKINITPSAWVLQLSPTTSGTFTINLTLVEYTVANYVQQVVNMSVRINVKAAGFKATTKDPIKLTVSKDTTVAIPISFLAQRLTGGDTIRLAFYDNNAKRPIIPGRDATNAGIANNSVSADITNAMVGYSSGLVPANRYVEISGVYGKKQGDSQYTNSTAGFELDNEYSFLIRGAQRTNPTNPVLTISFYVCILDNLLDASSPGNGKWPALGANLSNVEPALVTLQVEVQNGDFRFEANQYVLGDPNNETTKMTVNTSSHSVFLYRNNEAGAGSLASSTRTPILYRSANDDSLDVYDRNAFWMEAITDQEYFTNERVNGVLSGTGDYIVRKSATGIAGELRALLSDGSKNGNGEYKNINAGYSQYFDIYNAGTISNSNSLVIIPKAKTSNLTNGYFSLYVPVFDYYMAEMVSIDPVLSVGTDKYYTQTNMAVIELQIYISNDPPTSVRGTDEAARTLELSMLSQSTQGFFATSLITDRDMIQSGNTFANPVAQNGTATANWKIANDYISQISFGSLPINTNANEGTVNNETFGSGEPITDGTYRNYTRYSSLSLDVYVPTPEFVSGQNNVRYYFNQAIYIVAKTRQTNDTLPKAFTITFRDSDGGYTGVDTLNCTSGATVTLTFKVTLTSEPPKSHNIVRNITIRGGQRLTIYPSSYWANQDGFEMQNHIAGDSLPDSSGKGLIIATDIDANLSKLRFVPVSQDKTFNGSNITIESSTVNNATTGNQDFVVKYVLIGNKATASMPVKFRVTNGDAENSYIDVTLRITVLNTVPNFKDGYSSTIDMPALNVGVQTTIRLEDFVYDPDGDLLTLISNRYNGTWNSLSAISLDPEVIATDFISIDRSLSQSGSQFLITAKKQLKNSNDIFTVRVTLSDGNGGEIELLLRFTIATSELSVKEGIAKDNLDRLLVSRTINGSMISTPVPAENYLYMRDLFNDLDITNTGGESVNFNIDIFEKFDDETHQYSELIGKVDINSGYINTVNSLAIPYVYSRYFSMTFDNGLNNLQGRRLDLKGLVRTPTNEPIVLYLRISKRVPDGASITNFYVVLSITVRNNNPIVNPTFASEIILNAYAGSTFTYNLSQPTGSSLNNVLFADHDGDALIFGAGDVTVKHDGFDANDYLNKYISVVYDGSSATEGLPKVVITVLRKLEITSVSGTIVITIKVSDGYGGEISRNITMTISNSTPEIKKDASGAYILNRNISVRRADPQLPSDTTDPDLIEVTATVKLSDIVDDKDFDHEEFSFTGTQLEPLNEIAITSWPIAHPSNNANYVSVSYDRTSRSLKFTAISYNRLLAPLVITFGIKDRSGQAALANGTAATLTFTVQVMNAKPVPISSQGVSLVGAESIPSNDPLYTNIIDVKSYFRDINTNDTLIFLSPYIRPNDDGTENKFVVSINSDPSKMTFIANAGRYGTQQITLYCADSATAARLTASVTITVTIVKAPVNTGLNVVEFANRTSKLLEPSDLYPDYEGGYTLSNVVPVDSLSAELITFNGLMMFGEKEGTAHFTAICTAGRMDVPIDITVRVIKNLAPVLLEKSKSINVSQMTNNNGLLQYSFSTSELLTDKEQDPLTFISATSNKSRLMTAEVNSTSNTLVVTFKASGTATIRLWVQDATNVHQNDDLVLELTAVDLEPLSFFDNVLTEIEANPYFFAAIAAAVLLVILILTIIIASAKRRRRMREEIEALLISEIELEEQMLKLAAPQGNFYQSFGYLPPAQQVQNNPGFMLGQGGAYNPGGQKPLGLNAAPPSGAQPNNYNGAEDDDNH